MSKSSRTSDQQFGLVQKHLKKETLKFKAMKSHFSGLLHIPLEL